MRLLQRLKKHFNLDLSEEALPRLRRQGSTIVYHNNNGIAICIDIDEHMIEDADWLFKQRQIILK